MIFRLGGVDMKRFLALDPHELCAMIAEADGAGRYDLPRHHVYLFPMPNGGEVICNMTRITYPDGRIPSGVDSADMTYAETQGRKQAREYHRFLSENVEAFSKSYMTDTGSQVGIRQSRSIRGKATLTNDAVLGARKVKGAAAFSAWPIEAHGAGDLKIVYLQEDSYDIAFETLIPDTGNNLLVVGRCMSAEHEALASARVTAQCLGMGYAAGAACGLMKRESLNTNDLSGVGVADWMRSNNLKTARES
jgi:FAD dependent oxidoreductase